MLIFFTSLNYDLLASEFRLFTLYDPVSCSERKTWHCVMSRNLRECCRCKYNKVVVA